MQLEQTGNALDVFLFLFLWQGIFVVLVFDATVFTGRCNDALE